MKKLTSFLFAIALLSGISSLNAQEYKTALGVRLSSVATVNNSISFKHFLNEKAAVEALFSFGDPLALGALYEIHKPLATQGLQYFYGAGGYLAFPKEFNVNKNKDEVHTDLGAMGVIGLDYKFPNLPLNLSLDWKPELNIVRNINFEPAAVGLTVRFVFGQPTN